MKPANYQQIKHCLAMVWAELTNLSVLASAEDMKDAEASLWQGVASITELITILFPSDIAKTCDELGDMVTVILDRQAAERDAKGGKDDEE